MTKPLCKARKLRTEREVKMTDKVHQFNKSPWWEFGYRGAMILGMVAIMYLNLHYVPREEFNKAQDSNVTQIEALKDMVIELKATSNTLNNHSDRIADHELRIRALEARIR